jgi:hypothetical protein
MHRSTWKSYERRTAKRLNGRRIPVSGQDKDGADVITEHFHIQCKLRQGAPLYLRLWLAGIRSTTPTDKTGIVIWKEPGRLDDDAMVVLSLKDWDALLERWGAK